MEDGGGGTVTFRAVRAYGRRRGRMRQLILLVVLAGCSTSSPVGEGVCHQPDTGDPCNATPATVAVLTSSGAWEVTIKRTISRRVDYLDGGVQCTRWDRSCSTHICNVRGGTREEAIAVCRSP